MKAQVLTVATNVIYEMALPVFLSVSLIDLDLTILQPTLPPCGLLNHAKAPRALANYAASVWSPFIQNLIVQLSHFIQLFHTMSPNPRVLPWTSIKQETCHLLNTFHPLTHLCFPWSTCQSYYIHWFRWLIIDFLQYNVDSLMAGTLPFFAVIA